MSRQVVLEGIDDFEKLAKDFKKVVKKYPDRCAKLLRKDAGSLRYNVVKKSKEVLNINPKSAKSLGYARNYKISQVKGFGYNMYIEITSKSPHFHLVEKGHNLVKDGQIIGWVNGRFQMETTVKKYQEELPRSVKKMVDQLLNECGLN